MATLDGSQPAFSSDPTLEGVLDHFCEVKPQSFEYPAAANCLETCGNGALGGLEDGKVVLVMASSPAECFLLESPAPHAGKVLCLAVSEDQQRALSGSQDGTVKFWDVCEKREITSFVHASSVTCVAFSPDGKLCVAGETSGLMKTWSLEEKTEVGTLQGHTDAVRSIVVSKGGLCMSGSNDNTIKGWSLDSHSELATLSSHTDHIERIALSDDGQTLWSASLDHTIRVWNVTDWTEVAVFSGHTDAVYDLKLLKGGQQCVSISRDRGVKVWSLASKGEVASLAGHMTRIYGLAVSANEKWCVTCDGNRVIFLWDLVTSSEVVSFSDHKQTITSIVLTQDNQHFITCSLDKTVKVWSVDSREQDWTVTTSRTVRCLAVTAEHAILADGKDLAMWSLATNRLVTVLRGHTDNIFSVALIKDQFLLSASKDCSTRLWDLNRQEQVHSFTRGKKVDYRLAVFPDQQFFVTAGMDKSLSLWNFEERCLVKSVETPNVINTLIVTPDQRQVVTGDKAGSLIVWSLPNLESLATLAEHKGYLQGLVITADGKTMVSAGLDKVLRLWSLEERRVVARLQGHTECVNVVRLSRDGKYVATGSDDKTVRLWSLQERREVGCLRYHASDVYGLDFTSDGQFILTTSADMTGRKVPFLIPYESTCSTPIHTTSELATIVSNMKAGTLLKHPQVCRTLLAPYHVNSVHISVYFNFSERCKDYLDMGVPFLRGVFGSPLTVALERHSVNCTDVILQYLIDQSESGVRDSEWPLFVCITDDIVNLLGSASHLLTPFFSILMQTPFSPPLPHFITPTSPLPIVKLSDNRLIDIVDFDLSKEGELGSDLVEFHISLLKQNLTPGSTESLRLTEALMECEDKTVLNTEYVALVVELKWQYFYSITLGLTMIYAVMLAALVMILFQVWLRVPLCCVFLAINVFLLGYEGAQMMASSCTYWLNVWNYVDIFRAVSGLFWGVLMLGENEEAVLGEDNSRILRMVLTLLCFLRGFTYFRSFKMTRIFVYMTLAVVKEMYSFLVIIAYSVFALGVCLSILMRDNSLSSSFTHGFLLVLGDFDSEAFGFIEWLIFTCAAIVNIVIMMNLLISILGDAYEKTQMSVRENDINMKLDLVNEYESLLFWRRSAGSPSVLSICESTGDAQGTEDWAGKIVVLQETIHDSQVSVEAKIAASQSKTSADVQDLQTLTKKAITDMEETKIKVATLEEKVESQTSHFNTKMGQIEAKLETLITLLSSRS